MNDYKYDTETINSVMELRGRVSARAASTLTGVNHTTIHSWWIGKTDPYRRRGGPNHTQRKERCHRGHRMREDNVQWRSDGTGVCRKCAAIRCREYRKRLRGMPVSGLYYPAAAVLEVVDRADLRGVSFEDDSMRRAIQRIRSGEQEWVSLSKADIMLCNLGMTIHDIDCDPREGYPSQVGGMR